MGLESEGLTGPMWKGHEVIPTQLLAFSLVIGVVTFIRADAAHWYC